MRPPVVVDYFSGCGGTSLGLQQAGMTIIAGIDNDPQAAQTYRANFPGAKFFEDDVTRIDPKNVLDVNPDGRPVLMSGCAPCQPFSRQNRQKKGLDPRRFLLTTFQEHIKVIRPDFVVVENVPGLQRADFPGPLKNFVDSLAAQGYNISAKVLAASDYGVPQVRRRLVIVAALNGQATLPIPSHGDGRKRHTTVREWIADLPAISAGTVDRSDPDHAAMQLSTTNLERIGSTPPGGGRNDWPEHLKLNCHVSHSGHSDVYGRMSWDKPATGLTTRCLSYSNGRFGHPDQDRAISLREAACLQTFPRNFRFAGTLTSRGRQVGNAVPPLLARRIGQALANVSSRV